MNWEFIINQLNNSKDVTPGASPRGTGRTHEPKKTTLIFILAYRPSLADVGGILSEHFYDSKED